MSDPQPTSDADFAVVREVLRGDYAAGDRLTPATVRKHGSALAALTRLQAKMATLERGAAFEIGCRVRPRGSLEGELIEFNEPGSGALIRWSDGSEAWKALRNLEVIGPPSPDSITPEALEGER